MTGIVVRVLAASGLALLLLAIGSGLGRGSVIEIDAHVEVHIRPETIPTVQEGPPGGPHIVGPFFTKEGLSTEFLAVISGDSPTGGPYTFQWDFSYDGTTFNPEAVGPGPFSRQYSQGPSNAAIALRITIGSGEQVVVQETVTVHNVPATVNAGPDRTADTGDLVTSTASFTDPGTGDTHTTIVDWGDGTVTPAVVSEANGSGTAVGTHTYSVSGFFAVTVTVTDSDRDPGSDSFNIRVGNLLPVAQDDSTTVAEGGSAVFNVLANDSDPNQDTLTITAVTQVANGTAAISGDSVVYTHNGSETTSDSFGYTISDGHGGSDTATVNITVTPVNDPPVAEGASVVISVLANDSDAEQDTLTITGLNQGLNGTAAISGDSVTYTHDGSETTFDSFSYTVSDGKGGTDTATVSITVIPVNDPPVAQNDAATVLEGGSVVVSVLVNDSDPDQGSLSVIAVTQGANGSVTSAGSTVTYNHNGSETTSDSFSYTVSDGKGGSDTATVTITVTPVNDSPVAQNDAATVTRGASVVVGVLANDSDPEADTLGITSVTQGANGSVTNNGTSVTYNHNGSQTTSDAFSYTISDGKGGTDTATVTISVTFTNSPPIAQNDAITVAEGGLIVVAALANDSDPDGDSLTITAVTQGARGTVTNNSTNLTYNHNGSETTSDSFSYTVSDGKGGTDTATVSITVTPVNDAPVAQNDSATVVEAGSVVVSVLVNDSDPEADTLTIISVTQGANGAVTTGGGNVTYTHNGSETTSDSFTYTISDGNGGSDTATVSITVIPVNDPPVAQNDAATVLEGSSVVVSVLANDSDPDQGSLSVIAVTQGANGSVTSAGSTVTYNHNGSETTTDTFTYTVSDGKGGTDTATVSITVTPVNDAPVAQNDTATVVEGSALIVSVLANDSDAELDTLTITSVTQGANGTVTTGGSAITYAHNGSETTSDSFTYTVSDGKGGSDTATVSITVIPVNDPPVAQNDAATVSEGSAVVINVVTNDTDPEGDTLTISSVTQGTNGTVSATSLIYAHDGSETTSDSFTYAIGDGKGGSDTATVTITVTPVNDSPVAQNDAANVARGASVVVGVLANDSDPEGDTLSITSVTQGTNGSITISGDSVTYTHNGFNTTFDSFTYTIIDGKGGTDTATVSITVTFANSPPVATGDTATVAEGGSVLIQVLANDTDPDGDALTVTFVTQGTNGSVVNNGTSVIYNHNGSETALDSFSYTISDGKGGTDTASVSITVTPVNDPPVAVNDNASVSSGGSVVVGVLANDSDPEGDTLTIIAVTQATNGSVVNNGTTVTYTHNGSQTTSGSFAYTISDGKGGTATAIVTITIPATNSPPVATNDTATVARGASVVVNVLVNDSDPDADALTIIALTQGANGSVTNNGTSVTYTHNSSPTTSDFFTYTISDGKGGTATATVAITITTTNGPPVATNDTATVARGASVVVNVLANDTDPDADALTIIAVTQGTNGSVINNGASVTYTHNNSPTTFDAFSYTISDGKGGTATG